MEEWIRPSKRERKKENNFFLNIDSFYHESCALCYGVQWILPLLAVQHLDCTDLELRLS